LEAAVAGNWLATVTAETRRLLFCSEVMKTWDNMVVLLVLAGCGVVVLLFVAILCDKIIQYSTVERILRPVPFVLWRVRRVEKF
jgi:hypothetical protein